VGKNKPNYERTGKFQGLSIVRKIKIFFTLDVINHADFITIQVPTLLKAKRVFGFEFTRNFKTFTNICYDDADISNIIMKIFKNYKKPGNSGFYKI
jgi:hypothetical protein